MAGINPLTGAPLESWQLVVTGPMTPSGPRLTVVDIRPGARLLPWIDRVDHEQAGGVVVTEFLDNGLAGGTYSPSVQELPELTVTAPAIAAPWWLWALLALGIAAALQSQGVERKR